MKDFMDFYSGNYYADGILNAYMRVLDVYNELIIAEINNGDPEAGATKI
jgi:hypothetical protein